MGNRLQYERLSPGLHVIQRNTLTWSDTLLVLSCYGIRAAMECSVLKVWVMWYDTDNKCMMLWDSRYHETTRRSFLICGGLSATLKPSLIPTTGSWMGLSNMLQTSSHSCSLSTACPLTDTAYPLLWYAPGEDYNPLQEPVWRSWLLGTLPAFLHPPGLWACHPQRCCRSVSLNYQTRLQLPLQTVPVEASPAVWLDWGIQDWEFTSERWLRQDGSPGFCPCWGGGESVENLETSTSCWHGLFHLLLWVHLGWNFYHLTSLLTWHVEPTWCLLDVNTPLI